MKVWFHLVELKDYAAITLKGLARKILLPFIKQQVTRMFCWITHRFKDDKPMTQSSDPTIQKIEMLFADDSMPPMVLLDGAWGSGKTWFVKNKLIPHFKAKKDGKRVIFFSLYGVSSLDDFKDRLISAYYLGDERNALQAGGATKFLTGLGDFVSDARQSTLGALANGLSGVLKQTALRKIANSYIILDDLERVTCSKLIQEILGECLSIVENQNTKIIIVSNSKFFDENIRAACEKSFSDRVLYKNNDLSFISDVIKKEGVSLYEKQISNSIANLDFENLRAIKRSVNRVKAFKNTLCNFPCFDLERSLSTVLNDIIKISYLVFERNVDIEVLKEYFAINPFSLDEIDEEKIRNDVRFYDALDVFEENIQFGVNIPPRVVDFVAHLDEVDETVLDEMMLLRVESLYDPKNILSALEGFSDEDFNKSLDNLNDYIFNVSVADLDSWFSCADSLAYLSYYKYVNIELDEVESKVISAASSVKFTCHKEYCKQLWVSSKIKDLRNENYENAVKNKFKEDISKVYAWFDNPDFEVANEVISSDAGILAYLDTSKIIKKILLWNHLDLRSLNGFLNDRYIHVDRHDKKYNEKVFLDGVFDGLNDEFSKKIKEEGYSLYTGRLYSFIHQLEKLIKRLTGATQ